MVVLQKKVGDSYYDFPTPAEITYTRSTLDASSSGRNQAGMMFRDVVADKTKLQVSWGPLSSEQISTILQLVDEAFFTLRYPDAYTGAMQEMVCYVGDRSSPVYRLADNSTEWKWQKLSFSFIER